MSPRFIGFALATYLGWVFGILIFQAATAWVGRWFGMRAREVSVGYAPYVYRRSFGSCQLLVGLLPFGGFTRFREDVHGDLILSDGRDQQYADATPAAQVVTSAAGPLALLGVGALLLALPVWVQAHQLAAVAPERSTLNPCAVDGLTLLRWPATVQGQAVLVRDTAGELFRRAMTFESLTGWGGLVGLFITGGVIGQSDVWAWLATIGAVYAGTSGFNLLPLPNLNGFLVARGCYHAWTGAPLSEKLLIPLTYAGLLFLLVVCGRILWADVCWCWALVSTYFATA